MLAIDAKWGMGKTTFLSMWELALKERGFRVVMFNTWQTDFANEPFLALSEELRETLEQLGIGRATAYGIAAAVREGQFAPLT